MIVKNIWIKKAVFCSFSQRLRCTRRPMVTTMWNWKAPASSKYINGMSSGKQWSQVYANNFFANWSSGVKCGSLILLMCSIITCNDILSFSHWMQYHLEKIRKKNDLNLKMMNAVIHYKHRILRVHIQQWKVSFVKMRKYVHFTKHRQGMYYK